MSQKLALVIACADNSRTRPLIDGRVGVEGCDLSFRPLISGEMYLRAFQDSEFNVAELSLSNYTSMRLEGECPYVALPIYIARSFVHSQIYARTDRGIAAPGDLRGKRVGMAEYNHTAHTWVRWMLQDEYGLRPSDIRWVCGRRETNNKPIKTDFQPPAGVSLTYIAPDQTLSAMFAAGEIDAMINPHPPSCVANGAPNVGRLIVDYAPVEDAAFRRNGIFPIMHILGIRAELAKANPWLPTALYKAFTEAKTMGLDAAPERERFRALMGADFVPYGLGKSERATLDAFLHTHYEQGLAPRLIGVDDLFKPFTAAEFAI